MPTFRFRLETLLKVRFDERDVARRNYAQALEAQQILNDQIRELEAELADIRTLTRTAAGPGQVDVDRLLRAHRYELLVVTRAQQLRQQATRVAEECERRRLQLMQADREVRLLEKLKERQLATFEYTEQQRENQLMDEVAQRVRGSRVDNR